MHVVRTAARRTTGRAFAVVAAVGIAALLASCTSSVSGKPVTTTSTSSSPGGSTSGSQSSAATSSAAAAAKPVHIRLLEDDTNGPPTYGVGMPIVVYLNAKITEARDFVAATTVKVNGVVNNGFWYFEKSALNAGYPVQASFIPFNPDAPAYYDGNQTLWPPNADIQMTMNTKGVSGGPGLAFDDDLTLHMRTGDAHISHVDCAAEQMVITDNGKPWNQFPVSCGAAATPTYNGIKVVLQKGEQDPKTGKLRPIGTVLMSGPGYTNDPVPYSVRITNSGEYVHAASWNGVNIGRRSTSNGCTNLNPDNAIAFYNWAIIGDVVIHSNTGGTKMPSWDGFGQHNLPIAMLRTGGLVPTT